MSRKPLKTIVFISLGVSFFVIFGVFRTRSVQTTVLTQTQHETLNKTALPVSSRVFRRPLSTPQAPGADFQKSDFYRTIVDNNLFRPLGWRPPRPRESYRLIGTFIPRDGETPSKAILQTIRTHRTHVLKIGDKLDVDTTVTDIQKKHVMLERNGHPRKLSL